MGMGIFTMRSTDVPSDAELIKLHRKVDNHIMDYKQHVAENELCYIRQTEQHEKNMEAIAHLTQSTQGVVDAWSAASSFQRFVKWLSGFALIGIAITWFSDKISGLG